MKILKYETNINNKVIHDNLDSYVIVSYSVYL